MFRYSAFALSIHSEIELPDLPPGGPEADVVIRFGSVSRTPRQASVDEEVAIHALGGAFRMKHGREITIDPLPGVDPAVLRVLLVGRMMAFLLRQRGWLPLHASGVEVGGQAVLFLGASGSGKSTTAAAFHSRGHQVVTDDVGPVRAALGGQCLLRPAGSRVRLLDDAQAVFNGDEPRSVSQWDKRLFHLARVELRELVRVRRMYLLQDGHELRQEIIPTLVAVTVLSRNSFVKHRRMDKEALAAHLRDCASVAGAIPVYRLTRPRSLDTLPELVRSIEKEMENNG
jgi:hypothetical protein